MNLLNQALGVHEQALQVKSRRLEVLAQNIANADTPHYKARDIDFKAVMKESGGETVALKKIKMETAQLTCSSSLLRKSNLKRLRRSRTSKMNV